MWPKILSPRLRFVRSARILGEVQGAEDDCCDGGDGGEDGEGCVRGLHPSSSSYDEPAVAAAL